MIHLTYLKNSKLRQAFGKKNLSSCLNQSLLIAVSCDGEKNWLWKYGHIWQKCSPPFKRRVLERLLSPGLEVYSEGQQAGSEKRGLVIPVAERNHHFISPGLMRWGPSRGRFRLEKPIPTALSLAFRTLGGRCRSPWVGCGSQLPRWATRIPAYWNPHLCDVPSPTLNHSWSGLSDQQNVTEVMV